MDRKARRQKTPRLRRKSDVGLPAHGPFFTAGSRLPLGPCDFGLAASAGRVPAGDGAGLGAGELGGPGRAAGPGAGVAGLTAAAAGAAPALAGAESRFGIGGTGFPIFSR